MNLLDYDYNLPQELIAQEAMHPRDHCRLMIVKKGDIEHKKFYDIVDYLEKGDVLVLNETKVSRCKLVGKKISGGDVVITLVKRLQDTLYETRIKGRNLRTGVKMICKNNAAIIVKQDDDQFFVQFDKPLEQQDLEILTPPYIKKKVVEEDYQTVFARKEGSLAAPTAALHFTPQLLEKIEKKGVKIAKVQLDISFETFLPVRDVNTHKTGKNDLLLMRRMLPLLTLVLLLLWVQPWSNALKVAAGRMGKYFLRLVIHKYLSSQDLNLKPITKL